MKKLTILFLTLCSYTAQAQIVAYNNANQNAFLGIGGYSFTQTTFPNGLQTNPYVVSGPDFSFSVSAVGGITNVANFITATSTNTTMTIQFQGNNVRKFGCNANAINAAATATTSDIVTVTATTNLNNTGSQNTVNGSRFAGFSVTGGENEYIVLIQIQFQSPPSPVARIAIENIIFGDNTPQNVALNFDGGDDYVSIPSTVGNFNTSDNFTVTCWIKPDATQPSSAVNPNENDIISKWAGLGAGANNNFPFVIRYLNTTRSNVSERGKILVGQWDGTTLTTLISTTAVNDGRWHHVAFVRESGVFRLYINGSFEGSVTDNVNNATNNTTPLQFGRRGNNESYFKGEIDEVRIWSIAKTQSEIQDNRFCKTPNPTSLQAFYNFNNGVPQGTNTLISKINETFNSVNNGTLNNFALTGNASNFVTGQVKYVTINGSDIYDADNKGNEGSSWTSALSLQSALKSFACNDLFDVYVSKFTYIPTTNSLYFYVSFEIPSGMKIYGGFAGTETNINQRNMALIHSDNKTTLSGDLAGDDIPFNFAINRSGNSTTPVRITGNNVVFDGFTVSGAYTNGVVVGGINATIKNSRVIDNTVRGLYNQGSGLSINGDNATITNSSIMGNGNSGIVVSSNYNLTITILTIKESLIANHGSAGIDINVNSGNFQTIITNSTIASNASYGISFYTNYGISTNTLKNSIIYGNASGGVLNTGAGITNTITNSLVQGDAGGTNGNLNGNTVNPQFVSPLANTVRSDLGNYRLKDISPCINVGDDAGVSPFDLDRNPRPKGGKTDMGAYESNINLNEIISIITGNWENTTTWNLERIPLPTDKVIVNGHQVTVTTNTARAKNLEYKTGAILRYLSGGLLRFGL